MTDADGGESARHDPFAALRERDFLLFAAGRFTGGAAATLFEAAIFWQVYEISRSPLQLGLVGLARFLPSLGLSLVGGAVADRYDRRRIVALAQLAPLACSLALLFATRAGAVGVPVLYGAVFLIAIASAFENPARQALLPSIVSREKFANAITVNSTVTPLAFVTGPTLAGFVIAAAGVTGAYSAHVLFLGASLLLTLALRPRPWQGERRAVSLASIREGLQFVWGRQVLLGAMTLDMFAVIFGGAKALLPVYATDILEVGPRGYGLLAASMEVGALVMSVFLIARPPIERTGRALLLAVAAFGIATVVFGVSRSFPLSLVAYMSVGMADQVSVVMRQTTIQLSTPDGLRGRVTSVNMIFIGASNQMGAVESGFVAALTSVTFAVVSGGIGCLAVVGGVVGLMPELRSYRIGSRSAWREAGAKPTEEDVGAATGAN